MAAAIFNSSPIEKKFAILLLASFVTIWQKMGKFGEGRGVWSTLIYRVGQKKLYPPTFLLTLAIQFKLTQKFLWIMVAAGFDDNNNIKWTTQVKKVCFEKYFEVKSYKAISENFITHFPNHKPPYKSLIIYCVSKFRPFGTVENFNRKIPDRQSHSGRKRSRGEVLKDRIRESVADSRHRSTVRRCQELEISR